jgi:choice-of-anchor C domain-containing protein
MAYLQKPASPSAQVFRKHKRFVDGTTRKNMPASGQAQRRKQFMRKILLMLAILCLAVTPASAALFQNGSFEIGANSPTSGFSTLNGGSTDITGWTVGGHSIDWIGNYWQSADGGSRSVDLNGNGQGSISQTFDTMTGLSYRVTFAMAGNVDGGSIVKDLQVTAGGFSGLFQFDTAGKTRESMGWATYSFVFKALSDSSTLNFASLEGGTSPFYGPAVDNVTVAPVPAPATIYLLATGLIGVVSFRRRMGK